MLIFKTQAIKIKFLSNKYCTNLFSCLCHTDKVEKYVAMDSRAKVLHKFYFEDSVKNI